MTWAVVEIRFANPKSIPVVTAICPKRLNLNEKESVVAEMLWRRWPFLPASDPGEEGCLVLGGEHVGPEVGASGGRY